MGCNPPSVPSMEERLRPHYLVECTCGPPHWWERKSKRTHYAGCPLAEDWQRG